MKFWISIVMAVCLLSGCDTNPDPVPTPAPDVVDPVDPQPLPEPDNGEEEVAPDETSGASFRSNTDLLDSFRSHNARVHAAGSFVLADHSPPSPEPEPGPGPSGTCERCNGTGMIKPDGRIDLPCPDCGGDGIISLEEAKEALRLRKHPSMPELTPEPAEPAVDDAVIIERLKRNLAEVRKLRQELDELQYDVSDEYIGDGSTAPSMLLPNDEVRQSEKNGNRMRERMGGGDLRAMVGEPEVITLKAAPPLEWLTTLDEAEAAAAGSGRPILIYWTATVCPPCKILERDVLGDPQVAEFISQNYILVKLYADQLEETRKLWEIDRVPTFSVATGVHSNASRALVETTFDPQQFLAKMKQLASWAETKPRPVRTMNQETPFQQAQWGIQVGPVYAGAGSGGGGYGYSAPVGAGSAGGGYGYSGAGSGGGGYSYYSAPPVQYYSAPRVQYYSQPVYSGGYYGGGYYGGGGGRMVCGPNGCYFVQ